MRAFVLGGVLAWCGCPERAAPVPESDPLVQKLKAEQARLDRGGAPGGPPSAPRAPANPLAELVQQGPDTPVAAPLREGQTTVGAVTVSPRRLETARTLEGRRVKLTTAERFVRLVVSVSTTKDESLDLSRATLSSPRGAFPLARDAQRAGLGSPLGTDLGAGVAQELVLFFEVPPSALGPGLSLVLPTSGGTLTVPLQ
ncbi:MAG: hypothetical protein INH41_02880 [Myxococcaceae bacterium]|nr:hypothetical protein [Myxococcaceae bacterium]MCA3011324.1 hypothetical protein [Myxococcaceae bacterium]